MLKSEEILIILYLILVVVCILIFTIVFFVAFQRRKNKLLHEKFEQKQRFTEAISNAHIEIQEQTLKNVAWELHDNIGQLLSIANMQLNILIRSEQIRNNEILQDQITETKDVVGNTLQEVRSLSKTLNHEVVQKNGLFRSLEIELERINRLKNIETKFLVDGDIQNIKGTDEIIIFRILQEFLSNSIKYSRAKIITIHFQFSENNLYISASDDGVGFDVTKISEGSGLLNMKSRAELLKADFSIQSQLHHGTKILLNYTFQNNADKEKNYSYR